jgi:hypothetical protein
LPTSKLGWAAKGLPMADFFSTDFFSTNGKR